MLKEFKEFAMRGNVVDMAVGIIIGVAFGTIVQSLVNDVIMPPIGLALGNVDFSNLFTFGQAAVIVFEFFGPYRVFDTFLLGAFFIQADAGQLGAGIGTPGKVGIISLARQVKNCVADDYAAFVAGRVGKLVFAGDITSGKDMFMVCPHPVVHVNPLVGEIDADFIQAQAVRIR